MEITWDIEPDKMLEQVVNAYVARIEQGLLDIAKRRAPEITEWMKQNHPWQNVTGEAERALNTTVEEVEQGLIEIVMAQGVEYGIYLEYKFTGRDSVLMPALDYWGAVIAQDVKNLVGG